MEQVPGFEYGTIYAPAWGKTALYTDPKNPQYFYETPWAVSPGFAKVVGLKFIAGSDAEMGQPESIIVSESYARKLFPDGNALGAYLYIEGSNFLTPDATKYRICGIYEDLPENCQFKNDLFVTMGERVQKDDWGSQNYFAFFRLKPGVSVEEANRQIAATRAIDRMNVDKDDKTALYVFPIRDFYYTMHSPYYLKTGSRSTTALLVVIGMLIIAIACINLVNFSTALAPMRMRSINTQKVLGSTNGELRRALTLESVCTVLVGWLIALGITATLIHLNVHGLHALAPHLLAICGRHGSDSPRRGHHRRTVSGVVYDLLPARTGAEGQLRPERQGKAAAHPAHRIPVRGVVRPHRVGGVTCATVPWASTATSCSWQACPKCPTRAAPTIASSRS